MNVAAFLVLSLLIGAVLVSMSLDGPPEPQDSRVRTSGRKEVTKR